MLKRFFVIIMSLVVSASPFVTPTKVLAYSPVIAQCQNSLVGGDNWYYSYTGNTIKQLIDVRLDHYNIDALSFKIKASGTPTKATASIIKRDGPVISSITTDVTTNESWVYFDLPDAAIPRGIYYVSVVGIDGGKVAWRYGPGTCIDDSYAVINDVSHYEIDMGFGVYAYDTSATSSTGSTTQTSSTTGQTSPTGSSATSSTNPQSTPQSTTSNNSSPTSTSSSSNPTGSGSATTSGSPTDSSTNSASVGTTTPNASNTTSNNSVDPSLTRMGPWAIAWFVGWGLIFLLLFLWWQRRKKKDEDQNQNSAIKATNNLEPKNEK